ncbi:MAG: archaeosortase/exosortase family protein [Bacteroidetes bacterium]|nr:archaeosortase/exosortase family protein [Bacteroidota bacterium]
MGDLRSINVFLAKIFLFFFIWLIADHWLSHKILWFHHFWTYFYHILLVTLNNVSAWGLELIGYEVVNNYRSVAILGSYGVVIGNHCVGFGLSYGFAALIISYPGPLRKKLWFVPTGIALIMLTNVIRVIVLAISVKHKGGFVELDQHDFFNYLIYGLIFLMWIVWVRFVVPPEGAKPQTVANTTN